MFRIDAKQAKKSLFFALKRKKIRFRFASFRFEAKMTAHPTLVSLSPNRSYKDQTSFKFSSVFCAGPEAQYCMGWGQAGITSAAQDSLYVDRGPVRRLPELAGEDLKLR
jgi:hypothetical protein